METLYDDEMPVHYGFINLLPADEEPGDLLLARKGQQNGLCGTRIAHQVALVTGLHTGEVRLRVEWSHVEPAIPDDWEDVVEASVELVSAEMSLQSFEDFYDIRVPRAGWHRVRFLCSGMDQGKELDTTDECDEAPDRYLLQLWPAPEAPDALVRQSSGIAAYWHGVAQGHSD